MYDAAQSLTILLRGYMFRLAVAVIVGVAVSGCSSITTDSTQLVRVDALNEKGEAVNDAKCDLSSGNGVYQADGGRHTMIAKSGSNLSIRCAAPSRTDVAEGTAISRPGAGMFGNIIFGGGIGAIIDHSTGKAYNYPEWMQVEFGKVLVFDRSEHQDGIPMKGKLASIVDHNKGPSSNNGDGAPVMTP